MGLWIKKSLWRNLDAREKDWPTAPQKQRFTYIEMLVMVISWTMRGQIYGLRKLAGCPSLLWSTSNSTVQPYLRSIMKMLAVWSNESAHKSSRAETKDPKPPLSHQHGIFFCPGQEDFCLQEMLQRGPNEATFGYKTIQSYWAEQDSKLCEDGGSGS